MHSQLFAEKRVYLIAQARGRDCIRTRLNRNAQANADDADENRFDFSDLRHLRHLRLKRQFQPELNIARWTRRRDRSERRVTEVNLQIAEVGPVESVEDISLEPQLESLGQSKITTHRKVPRMCARSHYCAHAARASASVRSDGKSVAPDPAIWTTLALGERRVRADAISAAISK